MRVIVGHCRLWDVTFAAAQTNFVESLNTIGAHVCMNDVNLQRVFVESECMVLGLRLYCVRTPRVALRNHFDGREVDSLYRSLQTAMRTVRFRSM